MNKAVMLWAGAGQIGMAIARSNRSAGRAFGDNAYGGIAFS
jgi:hypothetical protein